MIVHSSLEEFVSWKGETREGWFHWDGILPDDAYSERQSKDENEVEVLEQPELLDVSAYPLGNPFRRGMQ